MALDVASVNLRLTLSGTLSRYQTGGAVRESKPYFSKSFGYAAGTGVGGLNEGYFAVRTLAASASETLDVNGGLTNPINDAAVVVARYKVWLVCLLSTADTVGEGTGAVTGNACSSITLGNPAGTPFLGPLGATAHTLTVTNGAVMLFARADATGWLSTAASADSLKVANNDGAVEARYLLALLGVAT